MNVHLTDPLTLEMVQEAATHLAKSERGRSALRQLLMWLDFDGCSLDSTNKDCVLTALLGVFGKFPGSGRDAMRNALGE